MSDNSPVAQLERQLDRVIDELADARRQLVTDKLDAVRTRAERAVLNASAAVSRRWLECYVNIIVPTQADPQAYAWAQAELARRKLLLSGDQTSPVTDNPAENKPVPR